MDRRAFTGGLGSLAMPYVARAQLPRKVYRIGILSSRSATPAMVGAQPPDPLINALLRGLRELGYVYGEHFVTEPRGSLRAAEGAGRTLQLGVRIVEAPHRDDLEQAISKLHRGQARGLLVVNSPVVTANKDLVLSLAARNRLAAVYEYRIWAESGGLMSYGPVLSVGHRQLAECADKILRGAKPAELPVQQPTKFEMTINLKNRKGRSASPSRRRCCCGRVR